MPVVTKNVSAYASLLTCAGIDHYIIQMIYAALSSFRTEALHMHGCTSAYYLWPLVQITAIPHQPIDSVDITDLIPQLL